MTGERFSLDTNILIYAIDSDAGNKFKQSGDIIKRARLCDCLISLQAVSEFYAAATRKLKLPPTAAAYQANNYLSMFQTVAPTESAVGLALRTAVAGQASYWDALLLATAAVAGCTAILTEDMADGTILLGVRIVNPFAGTALSEPAERLLRA